VLFFIFLGRRGTVRSSQSQTKMAITAKLLRLNLFNAGLYSGALYCTLQQHWLRWLRADSVFPFAILDFIFALRSPEERPASGGKGFLVAARRDSGRARFLFHVSAPGQLQLSSAGKNCRCTCSFASTYLALLSACPALAKRRRNCFDVTY
jgi:hypothetical protein